MGTYDLIMLAVLAGCTIWGLWRGMAWQLAAIASIVVSYLVALRFSPQLAPFISQEAPWNRFAAMLVLYLATSLGVWLVFRGISNTLERIRLKEFDHQIGGLFGLAQGVLLCTAITFFVVTLSEKGREAVLRSKSGHYIARFLDLSHPLIPEGVHQVLHPYFEKLHDTLHGDHELEPAGESNQANERQTAAAFRPASGEPKDSSGRESSTAVDRVLAQLRLIQKAQSGQPLSPEEQQQLKQVMQDLKTLFGKTQNDNSPSASVGGEEDNLGEGVVDQLLRLLGSQALSPLVDPDSSDRSAGTGSPDRSRR